MKLLKPCAARLKLVQHEPFGLRPKLAQLSVSWSTPRTPAYVPVTRTLPNKWRIPRFHCRDFGTLALLSMSHASGAPEVCTRASSVALSAVRYELFHATSPAFGVESGSANWMLKVGWVSLSVSSTETSKIER